MYANALPMGTPFNKQSFINDKIKMLGQMCITLTDEELANLYSCKTPRQIESYVRTIINNRWC